MLSEYGEGSPRAIIEGMAYGCIPVSFDRNVTIETIMSNVTGFRLGYNHVSEFCDIVSMESEHLFNMSNNARAYALRNFEAKDIVLQYHSDIAVILNRSVKA